MNAVSPIISDCRPECGQPVTQLPDPWARSGGSYGGAGGLVLRGVVDTQGDLPASGNNPGDMWLVTQPPPSHAWVWNGTTWIDVGEIGAGPAGPIGASGASGAPGPPGATGASGVAGASGASGIAGATGPAGATGATGPSGGGASLGATPPTTPNAGDIWISPAGEIFIWDAAGPWWVQVGAQGPAGPAGATGASGATGPSGGGAALGTTPPTTPNNGDLWITPAGEIFVWDSGFWMQIGGAAGPTGATGPIGATGATGPAGEGITTGSATPPVTPAPGDLWTTINGELFVWHPSGFWVQV